MKIESNGRIDANNAAQAENGIPEQLAGQADELELEAAAENLERVQAFVDERLGRADCTPKARMQIAVAVEEIFVNIARYAYAPDKGTAAVRVEVSEDPAAVTITFVDHGRPFDPLARKDPDTSLPAERREAGGLGILITKKVMDDVRYEYRDGQNILTLKKNLQKSKEEPPRGGKNPSAFG